MANTYTQIYIHIVFSVKNREYKILESFKPRLLKYIAGIIKDEGQHPICINSMPDHVHLLVSMNSQMSIAELVRKIKSHSTLFLKRDHLVNQFSWQNGYGAFSVSRSDRDFVEDYIRNQQEHHLKKTFKEEYLDLLRENNIQFEPKYVFDI